jgi:LPXTG-motif cell wall-anchored protein
MPKLRLAFVALIVALLSMFAAPAAFAEYAPQAIEADVPDDIDPGEEFTVTFTSEFPCAWTSTFNGEEGAPGAGTTYDATFTAPLEDGVYTLTAFCTWDPETTNPASSSVESAGAVTPASYSAEPQTDTYSVEIQVGDVSGDGDDDGSGSGSGSGDDSSDSASGLLPDTGGSNASLIAIGAGLVVVGGGVAVAARRRSHGA